MVITYLNTFLFPKTLYTTIYYFIRMKKNNVKLTLSIDKHVLGSIKKLAHRQGWIISKKVENFFLSILHNTKKRGNK